MPTPKPAHRADGVRRSVVSRTPAGTAGIVPDINVRRTGHATVTVGPTNGAQFKTLARTVTLVSAARRSRGHPGPRAMLAPPPAKRATVAAVPFVRLRHRGPAAQQARCRQ